MRPAAVNVLETMDDQRLPEVSASQGIEGRMKI
jgi:hypothetical protein